MARVAALKGLTSVGQRDCYEEPVRKDTVRLFPSRFSVSLGIKGRVLIPNDFFRNSVSHWVGYDAVLA